MTSYFYVIQYALLNFPIIALLFTLPFLLFHYKKYGAVPLLRTAVVYSFILYCMTVYFLAIFPLPPVDVVAHMTSARYSLVPLESVWKYLQEHTPDFTQLRSWLVLLSSDVIRELFFNICMFVPLGIYIRYYFKRNWWQTLLLGLVGSLFLELTQLSGLYGLYPRPYRLFDTTDLINNVLGTMVGFGLTPLVCFFLPSRDALDARAYRKGEKVPVLRRLLAFCIDWGLVLCAVGLCDVFVLWLWSPLHSLRTIGALVYLCGFAYFVVLQWMCGGRTVGKRAVRLRMTRTDSGKPHLWQLFLHYFLLYFILIPSPMYVMHFLFKMITTQNTVPSYTGLAGALLFGGIFLLFCIEVLMKLLGSKNEFFFCRLCRTCVISTIVPPPNAISEIVPPQGSAAGT